MFACAVYYFDAPITSAILFVANLRGKNKLTSDVHVNLEMITKSVSYFDAPIKSAIIFVSNLRKLTSDVHVNLEMITYQL